MRTKTEASARLSISHYGIYKVNKGKCMKKNGFFTQNNAFSPNNAFSGNNFSNTESEKFANTQTSGPSGLQDEINKYSSMSEERLMQEMFRLVEEGRKNGTLDNAKLEEFFNSASCMLSGEQITKLRSVIDLAKDN